MSLKIKTDRELDEYDEKRHITCTQSEILYNMVWRDNKYRSYFPFSYIDRTVDERFVGYAGAICNQDYEDTSFDDTFPQDVDIYICANGMKSGHKRTIDNLINIQNLVIDIDSHDSKLSIDELNTHILDFEKKLKRKLIVKPNLINRTGRGLQLWYYMEPCHVSFSKICLSVIDMLCTHIEDIMKELNETELSVDRASSMKLNGLFRLPFSYNTKARRWSECTLVHENLQDIKKFRKKLVKKGYKSDYFVDYPKKKRKKKIDKKEEINDLFRRYRLSSTIKGNDYTPYLMHRKRFLEQIIQQRGGKKGSRDVLVFALYATAIWLYDRDVAVAYCEEMNTTFAEPLKHSELRSIFTEVEKKQHHFTVAKFLDLINATPEEKELYYKSSAKEERKKARRKEKEERNRKVKELREQGYTIVAISNEMHLSRPTIYKILKSA